MAIDSGYLEYLQKQYAFAEWRVTDSGADGVQEIDAFTGKELPGWTLRRGSRRVGDDGVALVRGIWSRASESDARLVDVEVWLCASPSAAREYLLGVLGDMQGPAAARVEPPALGDIAFALGGESAVVFARGRAVVRVRNAGREVSSVAAEAKQLDGWLTGGKERR
jgi:hypothetical protein